MSISPTPPIKPFERLQIKDGLLITRDRWQMTQAYHRQRQNFQFQSLHQPGIVCGLEVSVTTNPKEQESNSQKSNSQNSRSLTIQPGIAIDSAGNPIIVPKPVEVSIASTPLPDQTLVIHLVVNYVDPDEQEHHADDEIIREDHRFAEKISLDELDVELCRITLTSESSSLSPAADVYQPSPNSLDHRYRQPITLRPPKSVRVAHIKTDTAYSQAIEQGLTLLLQSTDALYPALQPTTMPQVIPKRKWLTGGELNRCDLIVCPHEQVSRLIESNARVKTLQNFLLGGSVLCISADILKTPLAKLHTVSEELSAALRDLDSSPEENIAYKDSLLAEVEATKTEITRQVQACCRPVVQLAAKMNYPIKRFNPLRKNHPLLSEPFLFAQPPKIGRQPTYVFCWGGLVLIISNLANAWQLDERLSLSRRNIRTTQEWGINLLHYAWRHHHLTQLQSAKRLTTQTH